MDNTPRELSFWDKVRKDVEEKLQDTGVKKGQLAMACGVDAADLSRFLSPSEKKSLPHFALANLAHELGTDVARFLLDWDCSQYAQVANKFRAEGLEKKALGCERAQVALQEALDYLPGGNRRVADGSKTVGTLLDWPDWFSPGVVFLGDRREETPHTPADLLAASGAMSDLFHFLTLRLPSDTEILSDKTVTIANGDRLRELFKDRNLLLIGSPAVNLVSRDVNLGACFSFFCSPAALSLSKEIVSELEKIRFHPRKLEEYAKDQKRKIKLRNMMFGFARNGILDPVDYVDIRATSTSAHLDFGAVSLCRHPWSSSRVAIMVGGLHGPGTVRGIKLLAEKDFEKRPLGGIFKVYVPNEAPWEERYNHLEPEWDTHEYTLAKYNEQLEAFVSNHAVQQTGQFGFWNPDYVRELLTLVGNPPTRPPS